MNVKNTILGIALISALLLLLAGCSTEKDSTPIPSPGDGETPAIFQPEAPAATVLPPSSYLPEVPRISVQEVKAKLDAGLNIVVIDSRSENAYGSARIPGAISMPLGDMQGSYSALDSYEEIITYCQ